MLRTPPNSRFNGSGRILDEKSEDTPLLRERPLSVPLIEPPVRKEDDNSLSSSNNDRSAEENTTNEPSKLCQEFLAWRSAERNRLHKEERERQEERNQYERRIRAERDQYEHRLREERQQLNQRQQEHERLLRNTREQYEQNLIEERCRHEQQLRDERQLQDERLRRDRQQENGRQHNYGRRQNNEQPPNQERQEERRPKAIHNWPFKFRGEKDTKSLNTFLDRVECFALSEQLADDVLLQSIKHLLQDDALDWYARAYAAGTLVSWQEFKN